MIWVSRGRELRVAGGDPSEVLQRVRDGLVERKRVIRAAEAERVTFGGGWTLAWRTASKPISGTVQVSRVGDDVVVGISITDAATSVQAAMFGFERRQYETVIDRELNAIQLDVERTSGPPEPAI